MSVPVALIVARAHPSLNAVALQAGHQSQSFVVVGVLGGGVCVESAARIACGVHTWVGCFECNDVHHAAQRIHAVSAGSSAFDDFDAFDGLGGHHEVEHVVSGLGVC